MNTPETEIEGRLSREAQDFVPPCVHVDAGMIRSRVRTHRIQRWVVGAASAVVVALLFIRAIPQQERSMVPANGLVVVPPSPVTADQKPSEGLVAVPQQAGFRERAPFRAHRVWTVPVRVDIPGSNTDQPVSEWRWMEFRQPVHHNSLNRGEREAIHQLLYDRSEINEI